MEGAKKRKIEICPNPGTNKPTKPPYRNLQHPRKSFEGMNNLRKQNLLCDVTLVADELEIRAHKMVLAACSPYFCAMFSNFAESNADKITIECVDGQALQLLVDYVYSAEVQITDDNVQVLLPAANILQLTDVSNACCEFLRSHFHPTNCLGIRAFADLHSCMELLEQAESYIDKHFSELVDSEEFLSLSLAHVCKLISSDKLAIASEEVVFEAAMSWVNSDLPNRQNYLAQLMEHVRLPLLPKEYLIHRVYNESLLKSNSVCKDFIMEAMHYHLKKREHKAMFQTPRTKPRTGGPKILLVAGGQTPLVSCSMESYDFKEGKWSQLAELPTKRSDAGLAVLNGLVYAVGGFDGSRIVSTVDVYNPQRNQWSQAQSMKVQRRDLGVAVLNGSIFAVGGLDGSTRLNSTECFDMRTKKWQFISPMNSKRSGVGVGVLNGLLYAIGGYSDDIDSLSSVECYNPETDTWTFVSEMSTERAGAGVGVLDGILYAIGGNNHRNAKCSVECYNPESNCWSFIADMKTCRHDPGVAVVDGNLYVVGGNDDSEHLPSVEIYCPKTNSWSTLPANMTIGRSRASVAVLDKPM